ncbi:MAG: DUF11 domain-containing protein [Candidatus Thorarchaeota archaeon]|nr:MAG: DUF11 domain-containing protein [Candidatus Thorarchaeota archaeon]
MKRRNFALFAVFLAVTLVLPSLAASSQRTPALASTNAVAEDDGPLLGAIELMGTNVDAWGGVANVIATVQNATHYGYSHVDALEAVVTDQMADDDGYVAQSTFQLSGTVPFPNGAIGGPMAVLQVWIRPVIEVPMEASLADFADLSEAEAISLAEEYASVYETALSIELDRFLTVEQSENYYWSYGEASESLEGSSYQIAFVGLFDIPVGDAVMSDFLDLLADYGGFMGVVDAAGWPDIYTQATEVYLPSHWRPAHYDPGSMVTDLLGRSGDNYIRAHASHVDLVEVVQSAVAAQVSFFEPGVVEAVAGDESFSLLDYLDETGTITSKMTEDPSAVAVSIVGGAAPASLDIEGIPADWMSVDDTFEIPESVMIPGGIVVPAGSTVSDLITTYLSHMPRELALMVNDGIESLDPTILDGFVDSLWGSPIPLVDIKQMILNMDFSTDFPETPIIELDVDLLALVMERAGMTPDQLISRIDDSLAATNPIAAIVEAFVSYFDSYGMLDILTPSIYSDPAALEGYLNTFIAGIQQFMGDFAGVDFPAEFQTKEAIATFVEEHWDITLGALWTAMAADDNDAIKDAFYNILDDDNLQEHITPYLMADLGASLVGGIGFEIAINTNFTHFFDLDADLTMTFDADPDSISFDGPYLVVSKTPTTRTVNVGNVIEYTITVHNYGSARAYDVKVLDGMSSGLDGVREFYWTRDTLDAGAEWEITYSVAATDGGLYADLPAICVYFNTTLASFNPNIAETWTGSAFYTWSAPGYQILIQGTGGGFWDNIPTEIFGIPTLYVGIGGVGAVAVIIILVRRR